MRAYAATIFIGAFLLFLVQPLIGKFILPWFGGGPGVWMTCMLFFQVLLLVGYAYAHLLSRFAPKKQVLVHLLLVLGALVLLPITPASTWKPQGAENPVGHILVLLLVCLGLPYFVLSSTGPLMQRWFHLANPGLSPYRLYALSNAGSLLALLSYPFFFETHFTRKTQSLLWGWGLLAFAIGSFASAVKLWKAQPQCGGVNPNPAPDIPRPPPPTLLQKFLWLMLPACASILLLATTNKLCQDMMVIPFLWVLPLSLYLLSFIICFDSPRWYARFPFTLALMAALIGVCWTMFLGDSWPIYYIISAYSAVLFVCCMVCHGELYRLRPDPGRLTSFYLTIAAGGALGGVFVAVISPLIFHRYFELHAGLLLCALLFPLACARDLPSAGGKSWRWLAWALPLLLLGGFDWLYAGVAKSNENLRPLLSGIRITIWSGLGLLLLLGWAFHKKLRAFQRWHALACVWLGGAFFALGIGLWTATERSAHPILESSRNFYGVLSILDAYKEQPKKRALVLTHGRILHGFQLTDPAQKTWPTAYYGEQSGAGLALHALPPGPRRIGLVGLGIGTLAAYGRPGDYIRIYELNPEVVRYAATRFSFLSNCPAKIDVVLGDARLSLERECSQQFDLLVLDAFSSDAIPMHLLTREAFEIYARHLQPAGTIAVHISNHYLNLEPVLSQVAHQFHYQLASIAHTAPPEKYWTMSSNWILLTRNPQILNSPEIRKAATTAATAANHQPEIPLWTDDFSSLWPILK